MSFADTLASHFSFPTGWLTLRQVANDTKVSEHMLRLYLEGSPSGSVPPAISVGKQSFVIDANEGIEVDLYNVQDLQNAGVLNAVGGEITLPAFVHNGSIDSNDWMRISEHNIDTTEDIPLVMPFDLKLVSYSYMNGNASGNWDAEFHVGGVLQQTVNMIGSGSGSFPTPITLPAGSGLGIRVQENSGNPNDGVILVFADRD